MASLTSFTQMRYMNQYDIHKTLINEYVLRRPDDLKKIERDTSRDRTDYDILRANHRFLWDDEAPETWEKQFAKKYYDKLFKEYCIADLSKYKDNKVALRWRTEQEVVIGKGQFSCGNKRCNSNETLRTWEVNFVYQEEGVKKNALVKIRLCSPCSKMLNYCSRKREVKRLKNRTSGKTKGLLDKKETLIEDPSPSTDGHQSSITTDTNDSPWANLKPPETKSRDEEMEEYLSALLF